MDQAQLPLVVEPAMLEKHLGTENLLIVDFCRPEIYVQAHVPGAVHIDFTQILGNQSPATGMLPDENQMSQVLSAIGMTPESHVVAYDDEGGGRASRLLWTLDVIGHPNGSLLNGGLHAWMNERRPIDNKPVQSPKTAFKAKYRDTLVADKNYIMQHLSDPNVVLLDTRTPAEYRGEMKRADRAGHIPGAKNFDWVNAIDQSKCLRLKPENELEQELAQLGVTPDKEVIAYCQTNHRSAHTYIVLKNLGYPQLRCYPGSWSEWGNSPDAPVE